MYSKIKIWLLTVVLIPTAGVIAEDKSAVDYLSFYELSDQECEERGGKRVHIKNDHDTQMIDLQLDRYFYDILQPDRSMFPLEAGGSQALGCNRAFDVEQRWELISAKFITEQAAEDRYGDYKSFYRR